MPPVRLCVPWRVRATRAHARPLCGRRGRTFFVFGAANSRAGKLFGDPLRSFFWAPHPYCYLAVASDSIIVPDGLDSKGGTGAFDRPLYFLARACVISVCVFCWWRSVVWMFRCQVYRCFFVLSRNVPRFVETNVPPGIILYHVFLFAGGARYL